MFQIDLQYHQGFLAQHKYRFQDLFHEVAVKIVIHEIPARIAGKSEIINCRPTVDKLPILLLNSPTYLTNI